MIESPPVRLEPVAFRELQGWEADDHARALAAFRLSCRAALLARASPSTAQAIVITALAKACDAASALRAGPPGGHAARLFFERHFEPHRPVHAGPRGFLTGYYEPHVEGSRVATPRFSVPLYRRPPDLENIIADAERARVDVPLTHMRRTRAGLVPFPTRAEIEGGALTGLGLELMWLADPVDAFLAQVQGSLRVRLPEGELVGLTYDGKNGHPYTSIGRALIERGEIPAAAMSLATLAAWLRADERRGRAAMQLNASFVFFRETRPEEGTSALGALGTPLVPGRSLAVDTAFHALGLPIWVEAPGLRHWGRPAPFRRLMIAHDVGSAIRGPERGDIYFGAGSAAGARAGVTKHAGRFHVLLPRKAGGRG